MTVHRRHHENNISYCLYVTLENGQGGGNLFNTNVYKLAILVIVGYNQVMIATVNAR